MLAPCFGSPPALGDVSFTTPTLPVLDTDIGGWTDGAVYESVFPGSHIFNEVTFELVEDESGDKIYFASGAPLAVPAAIHGAP